MGMFVRALSYMASHGADGLRQASEDAALNASYIRASLSDLLSQPFGDQPCMHEVLFDDAWLKPTGVTTLDFAKAMIDEGYHPMTIYFPLVAHGAMLIEPTDSNPRLRLTCSLRPCAILHWRPSGAIRSALSGRHSTRHAVVLTKRARRDIRSLNGRRLRRDRRRHGEVGI